MSILDKPLPNDPNIPLIQKLARGEVKTNSKPRSLDADGSKRFAAPVSPKAEAAANGLANVLLGKASYTGNPDGSGILRGTVRTSNANGVVTIFAEGIDVRLKLDPDSALELCQDIHKNQAAARKWLRENPKAKQAKGAAKNGK